MRAMRFITVAASLILVLSLTVNAQQRMRAGAGIRNGIAAEIGIQEYIQNLRLTQEQRDQIKAIIQAHRSDLLDYRKSLIRARLALLKESPNAPADFGAAQARLMEIRQQVLNQIKAKLTSDQLAVLQERLQKRIDALQQRLDRLQSQPK
jgi:Spy/CpxP family protein refolding chaperone